MIDGIEIHEHIRTCQNEVFKATLQDKACILRLTDPGHRSLDSLHEESRLLRDLQTVTKITVEPMTFSSGRFIEETRYNGKRYYAVLFTFIEGAPIDICSFTQARRFGILLAELHTALSELNCPYDLPTLQNTLENKQLIHGDFNRTNVLARDESLVIIDFENACFSTYEYELANAIYMAVFDARHNPAVILDTGFIDGFLVGYTRKRSVDLDTVRLEVDRRVSMLKGWIDDSASAPLSVSTSTDSWKKELNDFINAYENGNFASVLAGISSSNKTVLDNAG